MKHKLQLLAVLALVLLLAMIFVQLGGSAPTTFSLTWFTVEGGGGYSGGGLYELSGSLGQTDAEQMNGGDFKLNGGYWHSSSPAVSVNESTVYLPIMVNLSGN